MIVLLPTLRVFSLCRQGGMVLVDALSERNRRDECMLWTLDIKACYVPAPAQQLPNCGPNYH